MYWKEKEKEKFQQFPSEGIADEISSPTLSVSRRLVEEGDLEAAIDDLKDKNVDYAPIKPRAPYEYLDVESGQVIEYPEEQLSSFESPIIDSVNILTEYEVVVVAHPDPSCWRIIQPADLNKKPAKEYFYVFFSRPSKILGEVFRKKYSNQKLEQLCKNNESGHVLGYWQDDKDSGVNSHLAEYLGLSEFKKIIKGENLVSDLGFSSENDLENAFEAISKFRNRIMHNNKSLIHQKSDVEDLAEAIEESHELSSNAEKYLEKLSS